MKKVGKNQGWARRAVAMLLVVLLTVGGIPGWNTQDGRAYAAAMDWIELGNAGFTLDAAPYTSLALDGSGTPYVAFSDRANSYKATVMKYEQGAWTPVGNAGFTAGAAQFVSLALDGSGTPYVAYQDSGNNNKATVMKYDQGAWIPVGSAGFSAGIAYYTSLELDGGGTPYVAYQDGANYNAATVMKYEQGAWTPVGDAGFTLFTAQFTSLALDGSGTPYVAYMEGDVFAGNKANLMKYDQGAWETVGYQYYDYGFSANSATAPSLVLDRNGTPYVVYQDGSDNKATVMKYDQGGWSIVGNAGFSTGQALSPSLALDSNGTPYVAYQDKANDDKVTVMKYDQGAWIPVGSAGFSAGRAFSSSLALNSSGTPYLAYQDEENGNKTTVMSFELVSTRSFESNGGSAVKIQKVRVNETFREPTEPTRTGYAFAGWYTDQALTQPYAFTSPVTGDLTLYAKWEANDYTVSYESNGGTTVNSETVKYNETYSEPTEPTRTGYAFAGWYTDQALTQPYAFTSPVTADLTLYAKWEANAYTVSYESNGGTTVNSETVKYNETYSEPSVPMRTGYVFAGWYTDEALTQPYAFTSHVTSDLTLYAKWEANDYTVSYESNGGTTVNSEMAKYDETYSEPSAPTRTGYAFAGWYTDQGLTQSYAFTSTVIGDLTLYAKWEANAYTVSYESNGGTTVSSATVKYSEAVNEPSEPTRTGYTFAGWYRDGALTQPYAFTSSVTGDLTLYAKWEVNDYTVSYESNGGTTVNSATAKYDETFSEPSAPTRIGYAFAGWYRDEALTQPYAFTSLVAGDLTLYAKWEANDYTVDFESNGGTTVNSATAKYNGTFSQPSAPTRTGYTFAGWYRDEALTQPYAFTSSVTGDLTLYAKWEVNAYTVSYESNGGTTVGSETVKYNETYSEPSAPTRTGYAFAGWYTDADLTQPYAFTSPATRDLTLYAKWEANNYTVSYESDGGTAIGSETAKYNETFSEPSAPTRTGYAFSGWYTDEALTQRYAFTSPVTSDLTLYAKWEANAHTVSFESNGGTAVESAVVKYNELVSKPSEPTRTGYAFAGWYTDEALTQSYTFTSPVTGDLTLYAKWEANDYTVSFASNGGTAVDSATVKYTELLSEPSAPTRSGYVFAGWYTDEALTQSYAFTSPVTRDLTLHAKWISTSAVLGSLQVEEGELKPEFSPGMLNYEVEVAREMTTLDFTLSKEQATQQVSVTGATYLSVTDDVYRYQMTDLWSGENVVQIQVTSEHGDDMTYTLQVVPQASEDAKLGSLTLSEGTLNPIFSADVLSYTADVANRVKSLTITSTTADGQAKLHINGEPAISGQASVPISLAVGSNIIRIQVTAEDGNTLQSYTLNVVRAKARSGSSSDSGDFAPVTNQDTPPADSPTPAANEAPPVSTDSTATAQTMLQPQVSVVSLVARLQASALGTSADGSFLDVSSHWAKNAVQWFVAHQLISGYPDGTFRPNQAITRGEFVTVLSKLFEVKHDGEQVSFTDTQAHWAREAIQTFASAGIVKGYSTDEFRPDQPISREEMVAMLSRLLDTQQLPQVQAGQQMNDLDEASSYARAAITAFVEAGLVKGKEENHFDPQGTATRAEVVQVLLNILQLLPETKSTF
ncbi:InlB B-repeat-containing protein [Paenibacillus massiliensis]|uniref:InlB B-repeat-containing protein n=1 Tax=Paenibacillus massiliensis TaxID=225917 RepID=UPI00146CC560|nr:InlB B-repeat-containing protein [Paenibacillus massiliensis]